MSTFFTRMRGRFKRAKVGHETRDPTPFEQSIFDAHVWHPDTSECARVGCDMSLAFAIAGGWNLCPGDPAQRVAFEAENQRREEGYAKR